jgi:hypothetical protein
MGGGRYRFFAAAWFWKITCSDRRKRDKGKKEKLAQYNFDVDAGGPRQGQPAFTLLRRISAG